MGAKAALAVLRDGPVPIYQQVKTALLDAIASGRYATHGRVPSERELATQMGVSRMTARQALLDLVAEGYLYARQGKGTFVAGQANVKIRQPLSRLTSFSEDMRARGLRPGTRVLLQKKVAASERIGRLLELAPDERVILLERLRLANGRPLAIERAHIPARLCPGLDECDLAHVSLYDTLRSRYGLTLTRAAESIEAGLPTGRERALLGRGPLLRIQRVTYLDDGSPVEAVLSTYRGDRYTFQVELR